MNTVCKRILLALAVLPIADLFPSVMDASETTEMNSKTNSIVLGGGCFWCLEALFETLDGVHSVTSGYAGGTVPNPGYKEVCSGSTGHAEVVKIDFDPAIISAPDLLDFFWEAHDPTTLNRQGADVGTQYRSIILYTTPEQETVARHSMTAAQKRFSQPIMTQVEELKTFYPAEKYHQDYFQNNPNAPYCQYVIAPKLKKLES